MSSSVLGSGGCDTMVPSRQEASVLRHFPYTLLTFDTEKVLKWLWANKNLEADELHPGVYVCRLLPQLPVELLHPGLQPRRHSVHLPWFAFSLRGRLTFALQPERGARVVHTQRVDLRGRRFSTALRFLEAGWHGDEEGEAASRVSAPLVGRGGQSGMAV
uniref:Uncharacterized protein n=1 Tax=Denticeps clupeoides TaxID=299321 RepID=A0AAY4B283_9TELE